MGSSAREGGCRDAEKVTEAQPEFYLFCLVPGDWSHVTLTLVKKSLGNRRDIVSLLFGIEVGRVK